MVFGNSRSFDEMEDRIERHRSDRDETWSTIEEPIEIAKHFEQRVVLVDCLTLWLSNQLMKTTDDLAIEKAIDELVDAYSKTKGPIIVVTNEVGLGIVPMNSLARQLEIMPDGSLKRLHLKVNMGILCRRNTTLDKRKPQCLILILKLLMKT